MPLAQVKILLVPLCSVKNINNIKYTNFIFIFGTGFKILFGYKI